MALVLAALAAGCQRQEPERSPAMTQRPIADVLATHTPELMRIPGVTGTYQGARADGQPVIRILVERSTPELRERLPRTLEGWPVEIEESGQIHALPNRAPGDSSR